MKFKNLDNYTYMTLTINLDSGVIFDNIPDDLYTKIAPFKFLEGDIKYKYSLKNGKFYSITPGDKSLDPYCDKYNDNEIELSDDGVQDLLKIYDVIKEYPNMLSYDGVKSFFEIARRDYNLKQLLYG